MSLAMPREADGLAQLDPRDARWREEAWRYSRPALRALAQQDFAVAAPDAAMPEALRAQYEWPQTDGHRLVFVNGRLSERHSSAASATAFAIEARGADGYRLRLGGEGREPLHIVHVGVPGAAPSRWQIGLDVHVEAGEAGVIEQYLAAPGVPVFGVVRQRLTLAASARLDWLGLSDLPDSAALYGSHEATLNARARLVATHVAFGGRMQRLGFEAVLAGERARLESGGVFAARGRTQADVWLDVRHAARETTCDVRWRGIAGERSRGAFRGGICVEPGADGSEAGLSSKNLLLSAQAEIDARPVLEIHADEVKAAHGATVGQLDERALFYLRSRGIPPGDARRMLVGAFSADALDRLAWPWLRERLAAAFVARLDGEYA